MSLSNDSTNPPVVQETEPIIFDGFIPPVDNYSKLPHQFINLLPQFETVAEIKVTLYILRHTWGYNDDSKKLTLDEFMNGRKFRNGKRMDAGTGLAKSSIIDGLRRAAVIPARRDKQC